MDATVDAHGGDLVMIDGTSVCVHHAAATLKKNSEFRDMGRLRGGLTTKIHALVNKRGLPLAFHMTAGQIHDQNCIHQIRVSILRVRYLVLADCKINVYNLLKFYEIEFLRLVLPSQNNICGLKRLSKVEFVQPAAFG